MFVFILFSEIHWYSLCGKFCTISKIIFVDNFALRKILDSVGMGPPDIGGLAVK